MRIIDDLPSLTFSDYARALDDFVNRVSEIPGAVAVFQFGEISHPGISDLDVLVVVEDDALPSALSTIAAAARNVGSTRAVFTHPPVILPHGAARRARYIHSLLNLHQAWGQPVEIESIAPADHLARAAADYADFSFVVRGVLRSLEGSPVGIRQLLILLKSCLHSLRLASEITSMDLHGGATSQLRVLQDAAGQKVTAALPGIAADTWRTCIAALEEADGRVEADLVARGLVAGTGLRQSISHPDGRFYGFVSPFRLDGGRSWSSSPAWVGRLGVDPSIRVHPGVFLANFATYGRGSGTYATVHRRVFGTHAADRILDEGYRRVLMTRVEVTQAAYDTLKPAGLLPMVPLGIGFRSPERIKLSRRRQMLRPVLNRVLAERGH